ncbi:hypothetical protein JOF36_001310 [Pseudonocardia parietis]|uniref:Uncharacterized protein n=1 Tax=Pseudonocardia parietis TaxID=570936 RepID=A0ABS4VNX5_9PSEU|nr:hypothetical protein [Pseudonocardia parietis]
MTSKRADDSTSGHRQQPRVAIEELAHRRVSTDLEN